jgi:phage gp46-like protein
MIPKITQASQWLIYHKRHQMITIQLKIVIFIEKRLSLNVEENQPMTSMCYF